MSAFVRGLKVCSTEQALCLARCQTLHDALKFEAVKQEAENQDTGIDILVQAI